MRTFILYSLLISAAGSADAALAKTSMLVCPPDHYLNIDPLPEPLDDANEMEPKKPLTAAEKKTADEKAKVDEMARWHCLPINQAK